MRLLLSLLFILISIPESWGVETQVEASAMAMIRGEILSAEDGRPVQFASVFVDEQNQYSAITDRNGRFRMRLPAGEQKIVVSFLGFQTHTQTLTLAPRSEQMIDVKLTPESTKIEAVEVAGESQISQLKRAGYAINSIDTQKASLTTATTDELLNRTAAVKIRQEGGLGSDMNYSINGLSGNSVRVYIDGVPINNYGANFTVATIPPSLIERVDVYKGVVPAELADDALGGAINVVLKRSVANMLNVAYSYGSYNTHRFDANGSYRNDKSGFTAGASTYYNLSNNDYDVWGDAIYKTNMETGRVEYITAKRFHDDYESYGAGANVGFTRVKWADDLKLNVMYSAINKDIQHGATMEVVYGNRRSEQDSYVANLNYSKSDVIGRLGVKAYLSYSMTDRLVIDTCATKYSWQGVPVVNTDGSIVEWNNGGGEAGEATLERNIEHNMMSRINLTYDLDRARNHTLSVNSAYTKFSRDVDDPLLSTLEQQLTETRYIDKLTASVSYDVKLLDSKLKGSAFYKFFKQSATLTDPKTVNGEIVGVDYSNSTANSGYGGAASYAIHPKLILTFSGEKAIRLPGFTELLGDAANGVESAYDLEPEKSTNFNLGVMVGALRFGKSDLNLEANLFYRNVYDMIERGEINTTDDTYGYENIGQIRSTGADANLRYGYSNRFNLSGTVSYANAVFNLQYDENGNEYAQYGDKLRNQPYLTSYADAGYHFYDLFQKGSRLSITYAMNYTHEFFKNWESFGSVNKATIPTQLTHDIGLMYTFMEGKLTLAVDAKNILNEQVFDNYALQKPGRMIYGKITFKTF